MEEATAHSGTLSRKPSPQVGGRTIMATNTQLKARDIMSQGVKCIGEHQSLQDAAKMMRDLKVGCLPICGDDDRLKGVITDRDITVRCVAEELDPATVQAGTLSRALHWIDANSPASEALQIMEREQVKRLPVIDVADDHRLVGMISEANLAKNLSDEQIAEFASTVYADTP
jgi:CBS domain-containing protein